MTVKFAHHIAQDSSVDSPKCDGVKFELDTLAASATAAKAQ